MQEIKHSVLMITYNQEKLLPQALDSLFSQTSLPYEVIISDDCSTDLTWEVIQHYYKRFPKIIKPRRNPVNLGVFGNVNTLLKLASGDIVSFLSGDDLYKPGIFEEFNRKIEQEKLIPHQQKFILLSNAVNLFPSGKEKISCNYKYRHSDLFKVKIRYGLNFRETGFSIALFRELVPIREDLGYHADWLFALDQVAKADCFYFIDKAFPVYRVGVGVVSRSKAEELAFSRIKVIEKIQELYGARLRKDDLKYLALDSAASRYVLDPRWTNWLNVAILFIDNLFNFSDFQSFCSLAKSIVFSFGSLFLGELKLRQ